MHIHRSLKYAVVVVATAAAVTACGRRQQRIEPVTLDVPDRADANPWVVASGNFVAVAWGATANGRTDVFVATSRDGGASFSPPVQVNDVAGEARLGAELPPRVALISPVGKTPPEIVVVWTSRGARTEIKTARSTDGGRSFTAATALQSPSAEGDRGWPALAIDEKAGLHAIWLDHRGAAASLASRHVHGGSQPDPTYDGVAMAQRSSLYYARLSSTDAASERALTAGVCYCCKTALATGSGDRVFAAWRHVYPGNIRDIAFSISADGGRSFSAPARVSEDRWTINGCPDDGPAMAVGKDGEVHLVWPTVVANGSDPQGAIFYASTRDGQMFTPRVRVPASGVKPSHPQVVADHTGRIFISWDDSVSGQRRVALAEVLRHDGVIEFGPVHTLTAGRAGTSPVLAVTEDGLVAVWTSPGSPSTVMSSVVEVSHRP